MCIFIMQRLEEKRKYRVKSNKSTIRKRRQETKAITILSFHKVPH